MISNIYVIYGVGWWGYRRTTEPKIAFSDIRKANKLKNKLNERSTEYTYKVKKIKLEQDDETI